MPAHISRPVVVTGPALNWADQLDVGRVESHTCWGICNLNQVFVVQLFEI